MSRSLSATFGGRAATLTSGIPITVPWKPINIALKWASVGQTDRRTNHSTASWQCSFQAYNPPQTAAKLCALNLIFRRGQWLQIYRGNDILMDNKYRKLFEIKQSNGCRFILKMQQNTFCGRAPPGPAGGAYALPRPPSRNGRHTCQGREVREWAYL